MFGWDLLLVIEVLHFIFFQNRRQKYLEADRSPTTLEGLFSWLPAFVEFGLDLALRRYVPELHSELCHFICCIGWRIGVWFPPILNIWRCPSMGRYSEILPDQIWGTFRWREARWRGRWRVGGAPKARPRNLTKFTRYFYELWYSSQYWLDGDTCYSYQSWAWLLEAIQPSWSFLWVIFWTLLENIQVRS